MLTDIHMPDMDGIELARHLLKLPHPPVVIFTTAFHEHALQAFEVNAVDYLMKPVRVQRLLAALQKVPRLKPVSAEQLMQLPAATRRYLSVTERSRVVLVPLDEIVYLKAELKYITIRTATREYLLEESLTQLEERVRPALRARPSQLPGLTRLTSAASSAGSTTTATRTGKSCCPASPKRCRFRAASSSSFARSAARLRPEVRRRGAMRADWPGTRVRIAPRAPGNRRGSRTTLWFSFRPLPIASAMRTLICGSLAYDTIMVFPDQFARHILPEQTQVLSVSFQIGEMRREWGGCAGNIAYNLKHIGGDPVVMATIGDDGRDYRERLDAYGIGVAGVRDVPGSYTAQAFIITDLDDNQITAFHPGAMNSSHQNRVQDVDGVELGIVSPDGRDGMLEHVEQFAELGIPFMLDPGQAMPLFDGPELLAMIDRATYLAVNDYEGRMLAERTGMPLSAIAERVDALVVTLGADGSVIHAGGDDLRTSPRRSQPRCSTPPAAAMPIAPGCSTALPWAGTGSAPAGWPRCWAR